MKLNAVFLTLLWSSVLGASYREKYINGCIDTQQYTSIHRYIANMLYSFLWLKDERISDWVNLPILWFMCSYSHSCSSRTVIIFFTAIDWICQSAQFFCLPASPSQALETNTPHLCLSSYFCGIKWILESRIWFTASHSWSLLPLFKMSHPLSQNDGK